MKHFANVILFVIGFAAFLVIVGVNENLNFISFVAVKSCALAVFAVCARVGMKLNPSNDDNIA